MGRRAATSALLLLAALACAGCAISHVYVGSPLEAAATQALRPGETTMADVLAIFGAPNRILRGSTGEIFVYRYTERHSRALNVEEPVITNFEIFSWSVAEEREDRLVILFDPARVVRNHGLFLGASGDPETDE